MKSSRGWKLVVWLEIKFKHFGFWPRKIATDWAPLAPELLKISLTGASRHLFGAAGLTSGLKTFRLFKDMLESRVLALSIPCLMNSHTVHYRPGDGPAVRQQLLFLRLMTLSLVALFDSSSKGLVLLLSAFFSLLSFRVCVCVRARARVGVLPSSLWDDDLWVAREVDGTFKKSLKTCGILKFAKKTKLFSFNVFSVWQGKKESDSLSCSL